MTLKERFIQVYNENIKREGADKLLEYLLSSSSDFFVAPASARYHSSFEGGLCEHSLNVFNCLVGYLESDHVKNDLKLSYSMESIAIVSLLHDLCKINVYKKGFRNVKDENGVWKRVDTFEYDDPMPYGHGEKSVYMISPFMKLTREEAFAIRYHMGYSSTEDPRNISAAFEMFPLAFALSVADSEATYFVEANH
ncbi:MAG: hydrolase [Clostridia bacterium]|nr:hydrolase [Clostridia bacterium]MBQ8269060.1 hydrolase [Clostridia bacterium]